MTGSGIPAEDLGASPSSDNRRHSNTGRAATRFAARKGSAALA